MSGAIVRKDSFEVIRLKSDDAFTPGQLRLARLVAASQNDPRPTVCQFCAAPIRFVLRLTKQVEFRLPTGNKLSKPQVDEMHFCQECAMQAGLKLLDAHDAP